jgi:hypothetical protein
MFRLLSFFMFSSVKYLASIFYRFEVKWLSEQSSVNWKDIKLIVFLNHTSLFEPIFIKVAPHSFIWKLSRNLVVPGADITLKRPIVGRFFKSIVPGAVSISRKRDSSWTNFMDKIDPCSVVAILPEGRMKRKDGMDKHGKPMSVRGGIADILHHMQDGKALFVYSGGLHHIQSPGQIFPRIFKRVKVNLELMNIDQYKQMIEEKSATFKEFRKNIVSDLNQKLRSKIPRDDQ